MGPGELLDGRFQIEATAGSGGMGTVYRARDLERGGDVAVKCMHVALDQRQRFEREIELLSGIQHPGIVSYVHHGTRPDGSPYLAMEWLDGEDLESRLSHGALSSEDAVLVALRAAEALGALHEAGIVHRDVKPANLFVVDGDLDRIKLLDFGIARYEQPKRVLTGTGLSIGTPDYMAPEQARGQPDLDARVDVFALGCVLFECLTGRRPFAGAHAVAVLAKILVEPAPRLNALRADAPRFLDLLVDRMLEKDRNRRPRDAHEVAKALHGGQELPAAQGPAGAALTAAEQRVFPVILTRGAGETDATVSPEQQRLDEQAVRATVLGHEGRLERLANGSLLVTFDALGVASDRVSTAARCALMIAAILGSDQVVLATGRGIADARQPVGEVIDRAAALLADANAGAGVVIDDNTQRLLQSDFEIDAGRLLGNRAQPEARRRLLGKPTACVGRERELSQMEAALSESIGDSVARVVLVTGPAGMGKSLLVRDFLDRAERRYPELRALGTAADSASPGSPFALATGIVRSALELPAALSPEARRTQLFTCLNERLPVGRGHFVAELLGEICGAPTPEADASTALRAARADPVVMSDAIARAWETWLLAECQRSPLLVLLEDLHWGDQPSIKLMDGSLRALHEQPLLVLATARPDVHDTFEQLWRQRDPFELRLGPVTRRAAKRLVVGFLGTDVDAETIDEIVTRSAGHPFFLEELIRAVAEGSPAGELPDTVLGMLQARFDALGTDGKLVLRAAAIFGSGFTLGGVRALLGSALDGPLLEDCLVALTGRELIERVETNAGGDHGYAFRHALLRDAAYAMLTDADRAVGHRLAGRFLAERGSADALTLAEHFQRGGEPGSALPWFSRAAEQAFEGGDPRGAVDCAKRALDCGADAGERAALELLMAEAQYYAGDLDRAEHLSRSAASSLASGSAAWFAALANETVSAGQRGKNDLVEDLLQRVSSVRATDAAATCEQVVCLCRGASQLVYAHRPERAASASARADELYAGLGDRGPLVDGWVHRVRGEVAALCAGKVQLMLDELGEARACFERAGATRYACLVQLLRGGLVSYLGGVDELPEDTRLGLEAARALGSDYLIWFGEVQVSHHLMFAGHVQEARRILDEHEERLRGGRLGFVVQLFLSHLDHARGDLDQAEERARRALDFASADPVRAQAMGMLALVQSARGHHAAASELSRQACGLGDVPGFDAIQNVPEYALAVASVALGDPAGARQALDSALSRIARLGSTLRLAEVRRGYPVRRFYHREIVALARELGADTSAIDKLVS